MTNEHELPGSGTVVEVLEQDSDTPTGTNYRVILYNCDCHGADEVVVQLVKATNCDVPTAIEIMERAHHRGRAICFHGERAECHRVVGVLREIRLQCEVDCD